MTITAAHIKELRDKTGAGMLDCKTALEKNDGDLQKAADFLRQKGIASADKKKDRMASQGRIVSYIHHSHTVGVLLEVNSETDFVAKTDDFTHLCKELAMQIAALAPTFVSRQEIPAEVIEREKAGYKKIAMDEGKKEEMADKIATGKVEKYFEKICLLDMPYVKDDKQKVGDLVRSTSGKLGENIVVRRFVRFALGETAGQKAE
ncbi:MAG TPA: translation elongation factor Ts [Candidatus Xenobia bacterium]|jgi:elongation factor Ts